MVYALSFFPLCSIFAYVQRGRPFSGTQREHSAATRDARKNSSARTTKKIKTRGVWIMNSPSCMSIGRTWTKSHSRSKIVVHE